MNKVIKNLILVDIFLVAGLGFIIPVFAIFISNQIQGGNIEVVGYAAAIYWIAKSIFTIPFSKYLDKNHGEKDDLCFIIFGSILIAIAVFCYTISYLPWHIYALQIIYGVGMSMNIPGYTAIFTRHIDKGKEAFEWGTRSALFSLGSGIAGALGGMIAYRFGFKTLFIGVGIFVLISAFLPLLIIDDIFIKNKRAARVPKRKTHQPHAPK